MPPKRQQNHKHNPNNKRQRQRQHNGSDESKPQVDPIFGQLRALPISEEVLNSINPNTIPGDGETYLAMVRKQAEQGDAVMYIKEDINYDEVGGRDEKMVEQGTKAANNGNTSSSNREEITGEDIKLYDSIITKYKQEKSNLPEPGVLPLPSGFTPPENFTTWHRFVQTTLPTPGLISNFDHASVMKLLIYCTKWLGVKTTHEISCWCFALLVRLNDLIEGNEVGVLRQLAVKAVKVSEKVRSQELTEEKNQEEEDEEVKGEEERETEENKEDLLKSVSSNLAQDTETEKTEAKDTETSVEGEQKSDAKKLKPTERELREITKFTCTFLRVIISRAYGQRDLDLVV